VRATDLQRLRRLLEAKLTELTRETRDFLRARAQAQTEGAGLREPRDEGDSSMVAHDADLETGLVEEHSAIVPQILAAFERLRGGEYGRCVDCGRPIELERLEAVPWTPRDAACQARFEAERRPPPPTL
jgi:RNA polymerase-binding transcription factor DksA